jgi:hypothetical protein
VGKAHSDETVSILGTGPFKEVFQPHLPVRLPCYDLTLVIGLTLDGSP